MERTTIRPEAEPIALIIWRFRLHRETRPPSIHIFPCPSSPPDVFTNLSSEFNSDGRVRRATCTAELMKGKTKISHRSHAGGNHGSTLELFWELSRETSRYRSQRLPVRHVIAISICTDFKLHQCVSAWSWTTKRVERALFQRNVTAVMANSSTYAEADRCHGVQSNKVALFWALNAEG